jgi:hypothetical protein
MFCNFHVPPVPSTLAQLHLDIIHSTVVEHLPRYPKRGSFTIEASENEGENIAKQLALMWQDYFYCEKCTSLFSADS